MGRYGYEEGAGGEVGEVQDPAGYEGCWWNGYVLPFCFAFYHLFTTSSYNSCGGILSKILDTLANFDSERNAMGKINKKELVKKVFKDESSGDEM